MNGASDDRMTADHASWVPGDQPAPRAYSVNATYGPGAKLLAGLAKPSVLVSTEAEAEALVAEIRATGDEAIYLEITKVCPGPIGAWAYSLRSHEYPPDTAPLADRERRHFIGYCLECDANHLIDMTLAQVEDLYHIGSVEQLQWEGYTWAWATTSDRYGEYDHWRTPLHEAEARAFGERVKELLLARRAAES